MQYNTLLEITSNDTNNFRYKIRKRDSLEMYDLPVEKMWKASVNRRVVMSLCKQIREIIHQAIDLPGDPQQYLSDIQQYGLKLYDILFPQLQTGMKELREILQAIKTPLLVSSDTPDIYWELLYDPKAENFWGERYSMGRRLWVQNVPGTKPRSQTELRCLMIADPNANSKRWCLPETAQEALALREWLVEKGVNCDDFLQGKEASMDSLLRCLATNEYDIIHYAGHIEKDAAQGEYALKLYKNELLNASALAELVKGNPLVFLNGCWGARIQETEKAPDKVADLTKALLEAGAQVVVGALFRIPDTGSRVFAETFYDGVLNARPVGEAMRLARNAVKGKAAYAAAWGSFVMYGDPCLCLEISDQDPVQELLGRIELRRENFDVSALRIIEHALEYGRNSGILGSPHLFAALLDGDNDFLRRRLREKKVPTEKLRDAFKEAFKSESAEAEDGGDDELVLSDSARKILQLTWQIALKAERDISERDLLKAFVALSGGSTGDLLREIGVDVATLDPDDDDEPVVVRDQEPQEPPNDTDSQIYEKQEKPPRPLEKMSNIRIGPLVASDCAPAVWEMLLKGVYLARKDSQEFISTYHFVKGMLHHPDAAFTRACGAYGLPPTAFGGLLSPEEEKYAVVAPDDGSQVPCSRSVQTILEFARQYPAIEARTVINDRDLLRAFLRQGGGNTGQQLQEHRYFLHFYLSTLFLPDGRLNSGRFSEALQRLFPAAIGCAEKLHHAVWGRGHLLYAWLGNPEGIAAKAVQVYGNDPGQLAEKIFQKLPDGSAETRLAEHVRYISPGLLEILIKAEQDMLAQKTPQLTEQQLWRRVIADGGGRAGEVLTDAGVPLSKM